MPTMGLATEEARVVRKIFRSNVFQNLIGDEQWDLTEDEEMLLWAIINRETLGKGSTDET